MEVTSEPTPPRVTPLWLRPRGAASTEGSKEAYPAGFPSREPHCAATLLGVNLRIVPSPVIIQDDAGARLKRREKDVYIFK